MFFPKLAEGQSPSIRTSPSLPLSLLFISIHFNATRSFADAHPPVWLGCSDSRVPETTLLGLQPGDVFTHRNIANILSPTDLSFLSVLEYAVSHIKVEHIVLCGHTGCGGCLGVLSDSRIGGVLDAWLTPLKSVRMANEAELKEIQGGKERAKRLAELNVQRGVEVLLSTWVVEEAVRERGVQVHGVLYDIGCGKINDLGFGNSGKRIPGKVAEEAEIVTGNHGMLVFGGGGASMAIR
jgi:carbonic anhydrase